MEVNSLRSWKLCATHRTLVFCIPMVSSSTQCFFRDFNRALVLEHPRTSCQQRWLFRLRLSEAKNFPFNFIL